MLGKDNCVCGRLFPFRISLASNDGGSGDGKYNDDCFTHVSHPITFAIAFLTSPLHVPGTTRARGDALYSPRPDFI